MQARIERDNKSYPSMTDAMAVITTMACGQRGVGQPAKTCVSPRFVGSKTVLNMKASGRDNNGRFSKGNPGGPGRPPLEKESRYHQTMVEACSVDDWQRICQRAVEDAVDGDHRARDWLAKYLVGEPQVVANILHAHIQTETDEENPYLNAPTELLLDAKAAIDRLKDACKNEGNVIATRRSPGSVGKA